MFLGSNGQIDGQVTPFVVPRSYTASVSQTLVSDAAPSSVVAPYSNKFVTSPITSPYTHNTEAALSRPILEASSSEYSSSAGQSAPDAGIEQVVASTVSGVGGASSMHSLHSPQSSVTEKQALSDASVSGRSQRSRALPIPTPTPQHATPQHADSGVRFPAARGTEEVVSTLGAPPAYTRD